jgi:ribosomal protein S12 methylthiotransferase accessory factor
MDMEIVFPGGKKVNALYQGFTIRTDQPESNGGAGSAPSPFDLFLASIGTCTGYYVLSFCQERGIATDEAKLLVSTETDSESGLIGKIIVEIHLPPEFPERYRNAVKRAAGLCSVKKHLHDPPTIDIVTVQT